MQKVKKKAGFAAHNQVILYADTSMEYAEKAKQRRPERSEDAHEFEAEKCRLSGTNSAQGTSETKIVLSFLIKWLTNIIK